MLVRVLLLMFLVVDPVFTAQAQATQTQTATSQIFAPVAMQARQRLMRLAAEFLRDHTEELVQVTALLDVAAKPLNTSVSKSMRHFAAELQFHFGDEEQASEVSFLEMPQARRDMCDEQLPTAKHTIQVIAYTLVQLNGEHKGKLLNPDCEHEILRLLDNYLPLDPDAVRKMTRAQLMHTIDERGLNPNNLHFNASSPNTWNLQSVATKMGFNRHLRKLVLGDVLKQVESRQTGPQSQVERESILDKITMPNREGTEKTHKFKPWFAVIKRSAEVVQNMITRPIFDELTGRNEKKTTLRYWAPEEKRSTLQLMILGTGSVIMYLTLLVGYVVLYVRKASTADTADSKGEKRVVVVVLLSLAVVSVFAIVTFSITAAKSKGKQEETAFSPGRKSSYFRPDTLVALFTIFLWISVAILLGYYMNHTVDDQTFTSFLLKLVAVLTTVRSVVGLIVSFVTRNEEDWREMLQFFMLRQMQFRINKPFGNSPWLEDEPLKQLWQKGFLPEVCKPTSEALVDTCNDPFYFLFDNNCRCSPSLQTKQKLGQSESRLTKMVLDMKRQLESMQRRGTHDAMFDDLHFALHNLMDACVTAVLCEKTHVSSRMEYAATSLRSSADAIGFMIGAMGASAVFAEKSPTSR